MRCVCVAYQVSALHLHSVTRLGSKIHQPVIIPNYCCDRAHIPLPQTTCLQTNSTRVDCVEVVPLVTLQLRTIRLVYYIFGWDVPLKAFLALFVRFLSRCQITQGAPSGRSAARPPPPAFWRSVVRSSRRSAAVYHRPTGRRAVGASARLPSAPPARSPFSSRCSLFERFCLLRWQVSFLFLFSSPHSFFVAALVPSLLFFCTEFQRLVGFLSVSLSCESLPELLPAACC